jgi:hypothetical protein
MDKHTKAIIVDNIELFLNYCGRFSDRQFITLDNVHKGTLERLENVLMSISDIQTTNRKVILRCLLRRRREFGWA